MVIEFVEAIVSYFGDDETLPPAALSSVDLITLTGWSVPVTGDSGRDKTTLLHCLNGLVPHLFGAHITGNIILDGVPVAQLPSRDLASRVGTVSQGPRSEFFTFDMTSGLASCHESLAISSEKTARQVDEIASRVRIINLLGRRIIGLSGSEKQRLVIGSMTALNPRVLLFDEPLMNLNLDGLDILCGVILDLKGRGVTTVIADHRLFYLDGVIDRCIVPETDRVTADITSDRLGQLPDAWSVDHGLHRLRRTGFRSAPLDPFDQVGLKIRDIQLARLWCMPLWRIDGLTLPTSGVIGITGANGIDRTTLMKALLGLLKSRGRIGWGERTWTRHQRIHDCVLVVQDVEYRLVGGSV